MSSYCYKICLCSFINHKITAIRHHLNVRHIFNRNPYSPTCNHTLRLSTFDLSNCSTLFSSSCTCLVTSKASLCVRTSLLFGRLHLNVNILRFILLVITVSIWCGPRVLHSSLWRYSFFIFFRLSSWYNCIFPGFVLFSPCQPTHN